MNIENVIRETVAGIFSSEVLRELLVLKGGAALQIGEGIDNRLSTDIDLSVPQTVTFNPTQVRTEFERKLTDRFGGLGFDVIDLTLERRPKVKRAESPDIWGGWNLSFKLATRETRNESHSVRRRRALIPLGSASSRIEAQISENEYCAKTRIHLIDQVEVLIYTPALLIAEKVRAICQQHPDYPYRGSKNRSRDFFDIHAVFRKHRREPGFVDEIAEVLDPVFAAKYVPMTILENGALFDPAFIEAQEAGFQQVRDTARSKVQAFQFYVEQLKFLVDALLARRAR